MIKRIMDWAGKQVLINDFYEATGKWVDNVEIIDSVEYLKLKGRNPEELFK